MCSLKFFQKLLGISIEVEEDSDFELVYLERKARNKKYEYSGYKNTDYSMLSGMGGDKYSHDLDEYKGGSLMEDEEVRFK